MPYFVLLYDVVDNFVERRQPYRQAHLARVAPFVAAFAPLAVAVLAAQTPLVRGDRPFRTGIELTSVAATVTDSEGRLITGLDRTAFELFEDGLKQEVTQFTRERVPVGL